MPIKNESLVDENLKRDIENAVNTPSDQLTNIPPWESDSNHEEK